MHIGNGTIRRGVPPLGSDPSCAPVFIVGCGRSGTTLLRLILNRHRDLAIFGESGMFFRRRKYAYLAKPRALRRFVKDWETVISQHSPHLGLVSSEPVMAALRQSASYAEATSLVMRAFAAAEKKQVWGEKTPAHVMRLKDIFAAYPNARVIHMTRDPRATVASAITALGDNRFTAVNVYRAARYWLRCEMQIERFAAAKPDRIMRVRYEDLVAEPETVVRDLCRFLGVPYAPDMLDVAASARQYAPKTEAGGQIVPIHQGLLRDVNRDAVEKWRTVLSSDMQAVVERVTAALMAMRGYSVSAAPPRLSAVRELTMRLAWLASECKRLVHRTLLRLFWRTRALTWG